MIFYNPAVDVLTRSVANYSYFDYNDTAMSKTRLIEAVKSLELDETKRLLDDHPALIEVTDRRGWNLLHLACAASHEKLNLPATAAQRVAALLIERGIEIDSSFGPDRCTPLFFAVSRARN